MTDTKANSKLSKRKCEFGQKLVRLTVVGLCIAGFFYQTKEFLDFYWTYPTVVDIQQTSPTYLEMPAFTICNSIGYNFTAICDFNTNGALCPPTSIFLFANNFFCGLSPEICLNGSIVEGTKIVFYRKFLSLIERIAQEDAAKIRINLEDYMHCSIEFAGTKRNCNLDNVMGSFYTKDTLPQFCYTIYSVWGDVNKERERIPKGAKMKFNFYLNASQKMIKSNSLDNDLPTDTDMFEFGHHNLPTSPYVQIAVHSPYFLPSPYIEGSSYHGGKAYEVRVTMDEKNLLPAPYQTNCTNYMEKWRENNGRGPINQLHVVQECRMRRWFEEVGCVPITVDYPHTHPICGKNTETDTNNTERVAEDRCSLLADNYNQPCHSISYEVTREDKDITIVTNVDLTFLNEDFRTTIPGYDCKGNKVWRPACSEISIDIVFDRFEITNLTYNAKYESLELFSVLGGYMGMWLGVSLVTIYDFVGSAVVIVKSWVTKRHRQVTNMKKSKKITSANRWMQVVQIRNV